MKKIFFLTLCFFLFLFFIACNRTDTEQPKETKDIIPNNTTSTENENSNNIAKRTVLNYNNIKAMWLSQFDLQSVYTNKGEQRSESDFKSRIKTVLSNVKLNGFNTVIVQVRPYADSFYPSEYYPPSKYVTGDYAKSFIYDPIAIIIEEAHALELSVHAWINPLRAMSSDEIKSVDERYIIKQWYNDIEYNGTYLVEFNGRFYLNPAYSEVCQLITNGVSEIVQNYTVDGVHMDDYFYPTVDEIFDANAYASYKTNGGSLNLKEFRYERLNKLISEIYSVIKQKNEELLYGISPEGNISNVTNIAFADVYTWCSENGYIDYICPQIYFGLEHQTHPFAKTADMWANIIKNEDIKLIVGMTFGKAFSKTDKWAGTGKDEWANNTDVLKKCLEYTKKVDKCSGISVFCYQYFYDPLTEIEVSETKQERYNFLELLKEIDWN